VGSALASTSAACSGDPSSSGVGGLGTTSNEVSAGSSIIFQAVADDSDEGTYLLGNYLLIIADCDRRIMLKFYVASPKARKKAIAKIDKLVQVVNDFREALIRKIELIDKAK